MQTNRKIKLLIDSRIRKEEYEYLTRYFYVIKIPLSNDVYEQISGHSDIFYCKINNKIICAPNAPIIEDNFVLGCSTVKGKYPEDVCYNACQIGNNIIGSKYTDKTINPNIIVKQGYTKCSIAVTGSNSCITQDAGIYKTLKLHNIDCTYIEENNIKLLDKQGNETEMKGFIGGASFVFDNKFVLFGDIDKLQSKDIILKHLRKYNLELVDFKGLNVYDYGGCFWGHLPKTGNIFYKK